MAIKPFKLNKEVADLERRLAEKKQELAEKKEADRHDKELIREIIKEKVELPKPPEKAPIPPPPVQKLTPEPVAKKTKKISKEKREKQIKLLTDLAFEKGVIHATDVARKLDDPYILDEFHDALVDELYNYLVEQGKIKQI